MAVRSTTDRSPSHAGRLRPLARGVAGWVANSTVLPSWACGPAAAERFPSRRVTRRCGRLCQRKVPLEVAAVLDRCWRPVEIVQCNQADEQIAASPDRVSGRVFRGRRRDDRATPGTVSVSWSEAGSPRLVSLGGAVRGDVGDGADRVPRALRHVRGWGGARVLRGDPHAQGLWSGAKAQRGFEL